MLFDLGVLEMYASNLFDVYFVKMVSYQWVYVLCALQSLVHIFDVAYV